jgi:hypothetical protein
MAKRAEWEASRDPSARLADEMERARLVASPADSAMLASQAGVDARRRPARAGRVSSPQRRGTRERA